MFGQVVGCYRPWGFCPLLTPLSFRWATGCMFWDTRSFLYSPSLVSSSPLWCGSTCAPPRSLNLLPPSPRPHFTFSLSSNHLFRPHHRFLFLIVSFLRISLPQVCSMLASSVASVAEAQGLRMFAASVSSSPLAVGPLTLPCCSQWILQSAAMLIGGLSVYSIFWCRPLPPPSSLLASQARGVRRFHHPRLHLEVHAA